MPDVLWDYTPHGFEKVSRAKDFHPERGAERLHPMPHSHKVSFATTKDWRSLLHGVKREKPFSQLGYGVLMVGRRPSTRRLPSTSQKA